MQEFSSQSEKLYIYIYIYMILRINEGWILNCPNTGKRINVFEEYDKFPEIQFFLG